MQQSTKTISDMTVSEFGSFVSKGLLGIADDIAKSKSYNSTKSNINNNPIMNHNNICEVKGFIVFIYSLFTK